MRIEFKDLKTKVDEGKTKVEIDHVFEPLDDYAEVKIHCRYLIPGERTSYVHYGADGTATINFALLFKDKVSAIDGLSVSVDGKDMDIKTSAEFLSLPSTPLLELIIMKTATHLLRNDELTEDEVKN